MLHRFSITLLSWVEDAEGYRRGGEKNCVQPANRLDPRKDQFPQRNENTQARPGDSHLEHDLDPLPDCLPIRKPGAGAVAQVGRANNLYRRWVRPLLCFTRT